MSHHTPGPWIIHDEDRIYRSIRNADNSLRIASVCVTPGQPNVHANAQLIAASPTMLTALKKLREAFDADSPVTVDEMRRIACDAIDAAEKL